MNGDVGMDYAKIYRNKLRFTTKDTSTIMCKSLPEDVGRGYT